MAIDSRSPYDILPRTHIYTRAEANAFSTARCMHCLFTYHQASSTSKANPLWFMALKCAAYVYEKRDNIIWIVEKQW